MRVRQVRTRAAPGGSAAAALPAQPRTVAWSDAGASGRIVLIHSTCAAGSDPPRGFFVNGDDDAPDSSRISTPHRAASGRSGGIQSRHQVERAPAVRIVPRRGGVAPVVEVVFSMRMLLFALAAAILIKECQCIRRGYGSAIAAAHCKDHIGCVVKSLIAGLADRSPTDEEGRR